MAFKGKKPAVQAKMKGKPGQTEARAFVADSRGDPQNKLPKPGKKARDKRLAGKVL